MSSYDTLQFFEQCSSYFKQNNKFTQISELIQWKKNAKFDSISPTIFNRKIMFEPYTDIRGLIENTGIIRYTSMICDEVLLSCTMNVFQKINQIFSDDVSIKFYITQKNQSSVEIDKFKKQGYTKLNELEKIFIRSEVLKNPFFRFIGDCSNQILPDVAFKYSLVNNVQHTNILKITSFPVLFIDPMFTLAEYKKIIQCASEIITNDDIIFIEVCNCLQLPETQLRLKISHHKDQHEKSNYNLFIHLDATRIVSSENDVQKIDMFSVQHKEYLQQTAHDQQKEYGLFYYLVNESTQKLKTMNNGHYDIKTDDKEHTKHDENKQQMVQKTTEPLRRLATSYHKLNTSSTVKRNTRKTTIIRRRLIPKKRK
jgi:hypothetical protein